MNFIMRIIVTSIVAFGLIVYFKRVHLNTFTTAIVLAIVLAILNAIVKPILILITFPITIVTLGLFLFVINALIIILADKFIKGFAVERVLSGRCCLVYCCRLLLRYYIKKKARKKNSRYPLWIFDLP